ncbi:hypothetical protein AKJ16_DCAP23832 [Drosera capensis]
MVDAICASKLLVCEILEDDDMGFAWFSNLIGEDDRASWVGGSEGSDAEVEVSGYLPLDKTKGTASTQRTCPNSCI